MLTARDGLDDRIGGLDAGADDYLTKPFAFAELLARLRALARRGTLERPAVLEVGDLRLDPATRRVWRGDAEVELSAKEFALLETFMRRPGRVLSRYDLLEHAWDYEYERRSNVVDVYVRYLREKVDRPFGRDVARDGPRDGVPAALGRWRVSRLSLRLRLTLAFVLAMALLLAAAGTFLYVRLGSALDEQIDSTLRTRADDVAALVRGGSALGRRGGSRRATRASRRCSVPAARCGTPRRASARRLCSRPDELDRARHETVVVERGSVRLLATPVDELVVVAGASLEDRNDALAALRTQLLLGGPLVLLLASLAGYVLAAATLRPVLARLEAGLERERRFVADASHELRTPLSLLKAELELALRRPRSPEELHAALASAAEETDRLVRLAEDLLVLARADEGELRLRQEPSSARELLDAVARRFAAAGRALEVDAPAGLTVTGDRLRLEQALGNLVDNALRYGSGTVRLAARQDDGGVTLSVADEGAGFPAAFLPHAFERFTRADVARTRGAAGLGLALVQAVARAHGGRATAANLPGGGAVVTLTALSSGAP